MSRYKIYIVSAAFKEIKTLPGHVRQRIKQAIEELANDPRPWLSKALNVSEADCELRRLRLDKWRVVYAVVEEDRIVDVLAVRKRPPYDYGDLEALLEEME